MASIQGPFRGTALNSLSSASLTPNNSPAGTFGLGTTMNMTLLGYNTNIDYGKDMDDIGHHGKPNMDISFLYLDISFFNIIFMM